MPYLTAVVGLTRQLRGDRALILLVVFTVFITSGIAAAVPRFYNRILDDELAQRIEDASGRERSVTATVTQRFNDPNLEIRVRLAAMGEAYQQALPSPLRDALGEPTFVFEGPVFLVTDDFEGNVEPYARLLRMRYPQGIETHVELAEGHLPQVREEIAAPASLWLPEQRAERPMLLLEIALSERTAFQMGVQVGDQLLAVFDDAETLFEHGPGTWFVVEVSGTFRPLDPDGPYWTGDPSFELVSWGEDPGALPIGSGRTDKELSVTGNALLAPDAYGEWTRITELADWHYTWTLSLDPAAVDATNYRAAAAQAGNLEVTKGPYEAPDWLPNLLRVNTPIPLLFRGYEEQTRFTLSVIALTALGVFGTAFAAFSLLGSLISERRRDAVVLVRGRGATRPQLIGARLLEGVLLCAPAASLGWLAAIALIDARTSRWSIWCAVGVALILLALLLFSAEPVRVAGLCKLLRRVVGASTTRSTRRLTLELALVVLAVVALAALRQRGLTADASTEATLDPLLVAAPMLLALVASLVGLRLYPHVVGILAHLAGRGRGLVWFIGLRRGSDPAGTSFLPFVVMLTAVSISVFASIIAQSVTDAQRETAWRQVGADFRVEASGKEPSSLLDQAQAGGIEVATALVTDGSASSAGAFSGTSSVPLSVVALDVGAYQRVIGNRDAPFTIPGASESTDQLGTERNPVPVLIANDWSGRERPEVGELLRVEMRVPGRGVVPFHAHVSAFSDDFPGIEAGDAFLLVSLDALQGAIEDRIDEVTTLFINANTSQIATLTSSLDAPTGATASPQQATVISREEIYEELLTRPLTAAVVTSFRVGAAIAALYAGLALLIALTLTARRRIYDLSVLRTLGLPIRSAGGVIAVEYLPLIALSSLGGVVLGLVTALAIEPGVDLAAFTGTDSSIALTVSWLAVAAIVVGLASVALATIGVYVLLNRKRRLGHILRVSD